MAFVCLLLQRSLWEKKIYTFLVPKGIIFHYVNMAGLQISAVEELVCS